MPLGMLDEVEVLIGQLGGNVVAVWGVAMRMTVGLVRAAQILSTRRARGRSGHAARMVEVVTRSLPLPLPHTHTHTLGHA